MSVTKKEKQPISEPLIDEDDIPMVIPEKMAGKKQYKDALIKALKNCENILRDKEGLTGDKALRNISYLLTLKLLEPSFEDGIIDIDNHDYDLDYETDAKGKAKLLSYTRFSKLSSEKDDNIPTIIKRLWDNILSVHPVMKHIFLEGKGFDIKRSETYRQMFNAINTVDINKTDYDILGNAYEEIIQNVMTTGKGLGQFFTQPLVKKIMVKLIKPVLHKNGKIDTCCDPTMGTGGFLITYLQEILKQAKQKNIKPDWEFIKNEGLYGKEIEPDTYQLAVSNMLISSGHMFDKLERGDSIREPIKRKFDNILANPPFGLKGFEYANFNASLKQEYLPIKSNGTVPLFIQAIISMLKVGGKCAVVIPYGSDVSSKTKKDIIAVREYLFKTCDLKEVILLPIDIFTYTKTRTCIFYFIKKREVKDGLVNKEYETKSVSFYEYDASEDNKKLLINVPIEVIAENSFSLNHEEYLPDKIETYKDDIELKTLGEMCKFFPKSKRKAGDGKKEGEYAFFSSSQEKKLFCDVPDYKEECIIVGTGGTANIKYSKMFSCSSDNFILKSNTKECLTKYIYYYLLNNINVLQKGFAGSGIQHISKDYINNIQIPVPPIERQQEIIETCEYNEDLIKKMEEEIKQAKIQARLRVSEILNNL